MIEHSLIGQYVHFGTPVKEHTDSVPIELEVIPIVQSVKNSPLVGEVNHIEDLTPDEKQSYDQRVRILGRAAKTVVFIGSYWALKRISSEELESFQTFSSLITPIVGLAGFYLSALGEYASSISKIPDKNYIFLRKS